MSYYNNLYKFRGGLCGPLMRSDTRYSLAAFYRYLDTYIRRGSTKVFRFRPKSLRIGPDDVCAAQNRHAN